MTDWHKFFVRFFICVVFLLSGYITAWVFTMVGMPQEVTAWIPLFSLIPAAIVVLTET